jgi:hypothetical protein
MTVWGAKQSLALCLLLENHHPPGSVKPARKVGSVQGQIKTESAKWSFPLRASGWRKKLRNLNHRAINNVVLKKGFRMKKSLVLGAAALAAVAFAAPTPADAGEVKMGGYYMFRVVDADDAVTTEGANQDDDNFWMHRLQLNMDFIASPKSHAHMVTRVLDSNTVAVSDGNAQAAGAGWVVKQAWLETEMWTVGVKVGEMPISLHDDILVNHDTTSFGTIMLSKSFGNVTAVLADVKLAEGNLGSQNNAGTFLQDEDDLDLYVLSILGKTAKSCGNGCISYQLSAAFLDAGQGTWTDTTGNGVPDTVANLGQTAGQDTDNLWLAATVGTKWNGVDLTATGIYESGYSNFVAGTAAENDGFLAALRASGKLSWGSWNGYVFAADQDFNNIVNNNAGWSATWDSGGPGASDLMTVWATSVGASMTENMIGGGLGAKFNAGGWTINPMVDYAELDNVGVQTSDSAWGGTLKLTHPIDQGVTLGLQGSFVDPDDNNNTRDTMHYLAADVKMTF